MNNFIITTDTTSDLPAAYVEQHQIGMLSLTYTINDTTYSWEHPLPVKEFYDCMRQGSLPTTSQANPEEAAAVFEKIINEQNADILHIAFSSGLSGSYNSARLAAGELSEKYPDRKIIVIDSLCASLGEGLLVHKAVTLKEQGHTLEETADWLESNKLHLVHNFTKVRGRKKSLIALVDAMEKQIGSWRDKNDIIFISHGDCIEDAQYVADLIKDRFGYESFLINHVGPTIGAHTGPGVVALFYMGDYR